MTAVVLETRNHEAAILMMNGLVKIVKGRYQVGQRIEYSERTSALQWVAAILIAAILLTGSAGLWFNENYVAYAEVSIEGEQSVVYTLNRRNRVLSVWSSDEDLMESLGEMKFQPVEKAVEKTVELMDEPVHIDIAADDERVEKAVESAMGEREYTMTHSRKEMAVERSSELPQGTPQNSRDEMEFDELPQDTPQNSRDEMSMEPDEAGREDPSEAVMSERQMPESPEKSKVDDPEIPESVPNPENQTSGIIIPQDEFTKDRDTESITTSPQEKLNDGQCEFNDGQQETPSERHESPNRSQPAGESRRDRR